MTRVRQVFIYRFTFILALSISSTRRESSISSRSPSVSKRAVTFNERLCYGLQIVW
jgi:hypothetical protein